MAGRQIRRGTNAQRVALGGLSAGELGFETDTKDVYIGATGGDQLVSDASAWAHLSGQDQAVKKASKPEYASLFENQPVIYRSRKVSLVSPYASKASVYKGQAHCHTTNSDGIQSPTDVVTAYRDAGYDFISITDHNFNTPDPGVSGILFIPGIEDTLTEHLIRINTATSTASTPQAVIDKAIGEGSFVFVCHPNWPGGYPADPSWTDVELESVEGYYGAEVWNALVAPNQNAETRIDSLLSAYRKLYLLAVDDSHDVEAAYSKTSSVRVFADSLTVSDIMENLKRGNFYSSNGAEISSIVVSKRTITVTAPVAGTIDFIGKGGVVVQTSAAAVSAAYTVFGDEVYIRIRITRDSDGKMAWTNPIYVSGEPVAELAKGGVVRGNLYAYGTGNFRNASQDSLEHLRLGWWFSLIGESNFHITNNAYYRLGAIWRYTRTAAAGKIAIELDGALTFQNAPVGTIDTEINFTTRFRIAPTGSLEFDPGSGADETRAFNFNIDTTNYGKILIPAGSSGAMAFWTGPFGGPVAERVRILNDGKVGINDIAPAEFLDVNGNANVTGVYKVADVQVVGARVVDARVDDAINAGTWDATTAGVLEALRDAAIAHGWIKAA